MGIIKDYVAPVKTKPYTAEVAELANAGEGAAYVINANEVSRKIETEIALFQAAARDAGYSARITERDEDGSGRVVFVLAPRRQRKATSDKLDNATHDEKPKSKSKAS